MYAGPGIYHHIKSDCYYEAVGLSLDECDRETVVVIYKPHYGSNKQDLVVQNLDFYHRPLAEFERRFIKV